MNDAGKRPHADKSTREQSPTDVERQTPRSLFTSGDPLPNLEMWILERRLGGGGFGEVWLARHERKGEAAVKFCTDPTARHKLVTHEKAVVARVMRYCGNHANVVPLLECNLSGDIPWLMYEYVEGGTLAEALAEWRDLSPPRRLGRTVRTLHAIAGALATFHKLDPPLIHRDLKPQNVLMAGNTPRITDFGIGGAAVDTGRFEALDSGSDLAVRVPTMLQSVGSSKYAPHEQFLGAPPSPRDDVFALGVIAYQLILGDLNAVPHADASSELRALRIPSDLVTLIAKSVALDPVRRPKDAGEWEKTLATLMRKKTVTGKPSALPPPVASASNNDGTEELDSLGNSEVTAALVTQTLDLTARGRWYSRPAGQPDAEWQIVATTPATVRLSAGEVYRFSINSAATVEDVNAIALLAGLTSLRYLNLSYCAAVTDAGLEYLKAFSGLRQLYLRGCNRITDAGLRHLHTLTGLQTLELSDCKQLTAAGVAAIEKVLPKCKVLG
jgi:serine/threonine protein kinase